MSGGPSTTQSSAYGTLTSSQGSSNKASQCIYCKEWKLASLIDSHQKSCSMNNKEDENVDHPMSSSNAISTRKNSLLKTLNVKELKQKRLKAFKQEMKQHYETSVD